MDFKRKLRTTGQGLKEQLWRLRGGQAPQGDWQDTTILETKADSYSPTLMPNYSVDELETALRGQKPPRRLADARADGHSDFEAGTSQMELDEGTLFAPLEQPDGGRHARAIQASRVKVAPPSALDSDFAPRGHRDRQEQKKATVGVGASPRP